MNKTNFKFKIGKSRTSDLILLHTKCYYFNRVWYWSLYTDQFTSSDCDFPVTSLPNLIYCFGIVLFHWAFATATVTNFAVLLENHFVTDSLAM